MDRLQTMTVFAVVAELGGFAPASRRLNLSPPTVTRAVSELESRIGARLFHRTTRSVALTEAGERYLADCKRILSEIDVAEQQAAGVHTTPSGLVTVAASFLFGRMVLWSVLDELLIDYPDISVSAMFSDNITHMHDDALDVSVRIADLPDSSLSAIRVGGVKRVLCASPEYFAQHGRPDKPSELADHNLIDFVNMTTGGEWHFENGRKQSTFRPVSRLRVNFGDVAIKAAVNHRGIARVLSYMIKEELKNGSLECVLSEYEPPEIPVHVIHKEAGQISARVRAVVDYLVGALRKHPAIN